LKNNPIEHVYIHVPFCLRKCGYCSFYSEVFDENSKANYLLTLQNEISLWQQDYCLKPKTIYFGGGTPSLLSKNEINFIISQFDLSQIEEITLEANPVNISERYAKELSKTKVNRVSLGIQSCKDEELVLLGRLHNSEQAETAYKTLRNSGFQNISMDFIYGLPNQTKADILFSLEKFIQFKPEHISTYCLSLENDVPMYPLKTKIPKDDVVSDFYYLIREKLISAGYKQYEVSNFAKPGFESKHNLCYWNDKAYLGLGPAASGYLNNGRYTNPADLIKYNTQIENKQIHLNLKTISPDDHEKEFIFLTLRKVEGFSLIEFKEKFDFNFLEKYKKIVDRFIQENLLEVEGDFIHLSPVAYFVSNEIFAEFM
jgi:oxygen-independent coproporphyrinogen III oxidase